MRERSAGFILFRRKNGKTKFLLIHSSEHSYWSFPKGVIDEGENEIKTALRELKEETGITNVRIIEGFKTINRYFYTRQGERISKTVSYFLAETVTDKVTLSYEHDNYTWAEPETALQMLPYPSLKRVLKEAVDFLQNLQNEKNGEKKK
ncbi:MAG: bis(5'-nucleosyl)-tetraphosphatase [Planctomycetota bacterium]|nr:bis(5'-nucleosyl)-tetraphosphatase [Planctomycetota bacterium]